MNRHSVGSLATVLAFIGMFCVMISGVSLGGFGKVFLAGMFLLPLCGAIVGLKAKKGVGKWLLIFMNGAALCVIGYLLVLAYGVSEN